MQIAEVYSRLTANVIIGPAPSFHLSPPWSNPPTEVQSSGGYINSSGDVTNYLQPLPDLLIPPSTQATTMVAPENYTEFSPNSMVPVNAESNMDSAHYNTEMMPPSQQFNGRNSTIFMENYCDNVG